MSSPRAYVCNIVFASHIDKTVLADGMYELIPKSEGGDPEVQVNAAINIRTTDGVMYDIMTLAENPFCVDKFC